MVYFWCLHHLVGLDVGFQHHRYLLCRHCCIQVFFITYKAKFQEGLAETILNRGYASHNGLMYRPCRGLCRDAPETRPVLVSITLRLRILAEHFLFLCRICSPSWFCRGSRLQIHSLVTRCTLRTHVLIPSDRYDFSILSAISGRC